LVLQRPRKPEDAGGLTAAREEEEEEEKEEEKEEEEEEGRGLRCKPPGWGRGREGDTDSGSTPMEVSPKGEAVGGFLRNALGLLLLEEEEVKSKEEEGEVKSKAA
jgi:hypothetical protein